MKSLATFGFSPHTYLIEDEDLPFEVSNQSTQDTLGLLKRDILDNSPRINPGLSATYCSKKKSDDIKIICGQSREAESRAKY